MKNKVKIRFPYVVDRVLEKDQDIYWLCIEKSKFKLKDPIEKQESNFFFISKKAANKIVKELNEIHNGTFVNCVRKERAKAGFKFSELLYGKDDGSYTADAGSYWRYRKRNDAIYDAKNSPTTRYYMHRYHLKSKLKLHNWLKPLEIEVEEQQEQCK